MSISWMLFIEGQLIAGLDSSTHRRVLWNCWIIYPVGMRSDSWFLCVENIWLEIQQQQFVVMEGKRRVHITLWPALPFFTSSFTFCVSDKHFATPAVTSAKYVYVTNKIRFDLTHLVILFLVRMPWSTPKSLSLLSFWERTLSQGMSSM